MIDVQLNPGSKEYEAVAHAIVLASRPGGVWRSEVTEHTGIDINRLGTKMGHHPDLDKPHRMTITRHPARRYHYLIEPL